MSDPLLGASVPPPGQDPTRQSGATSIAGYRARLGSPRNRLFLLWVVFSVFVFWTPLRTLVDYSLRRGHEFDKYSHILLIPFITIVLVFLERKRIFTKVQYSPRWGIPLLFIGLTSNFSAAWAWDQLGAENSLSARVLALVTVWIAGFILCYGTRAFRAGAFALLFLFLTVPIPGALLDIPLAAVQHGSAEVCSLIFTLAGVPVLREGFVFSLPAVSIEVARECSGIHSTLALFIVCLLSGHFFLPPIWKKLALILLVLPIVCVSNGLRIAGLTLLSVYVDPSFLSGNLHRNGGIGFFLLALLLMYAVLYPLQRGHSAKRLEPNPPDHGKPEGRG
jgi:exosortase